MLHQMRPNCDDPGENEKNKNEFLSTTRVFIELFAMSVEYQDLLIKRRWLVSDNCVPMKTLPLLIRRRKFMCICQMHMFERLGSDMQLQQQTCVVCANI